MKAVHGPIVQATSMHKKQPTQENMHTLHCLTTAVNCLGLSAFSGTLAAELKVLMGCQRGVRQVTQSNLGSASANRLAFH
jgi:hypothetical protein